jgi:hypothetical protein
MRFRRGNHKFGFVAVSPAIHFRLIFLLFLYLVERTNLRLSPANVVCASSSASRMRRKGVLWPFNQIECDLEDSS